ncbi:unnamed protein product [Pedinophyceae sp. YPF-701]|nr:unnamed protein product [Pedinophyceae sp. YPF-701]
MVAASVDVSELKKRIFEIQAQKDTVEAEMDACLARLNAPGQPGETEPLVDREGFPRDDVDIPQIRTDRKRVIELRNDHKGIMKQLGELLTQLHAAVKHEVPRPSAADAAQTGAAPPDAPAAPATAPFAVIDQVAADSPAQAAGVQLGDRVVAVGDIRGPPAEAFERVAAWLPTAEGVKVALVVEREGRLVTLALVPRRWGGRGLLGCHMKPL